MSELKSDLSLAIEKGNRLKSKCEGLDTGTIEIATESNIWGVKENASVFQNCTKLLKSYQKLLNTDATRILMIGEMFSVSDHNMASKM